MYNQVKELFQKGFNDSQIGCITGLDRGTVGKYRLMSKDDFLLLLQQQLQRSGTAGGMKRVLPAKVEEGLQCAVGRLLGSGVAGMRAVRASVSWPARPAGLRKRSEAECGAYGGFFSAEQRFSTERNESVTK